MRLIILITILIFSHISLTKADDISDFQIEGISIGDSLLNYFNELEINQNSSDEWYSHKKDSKKFLKVDFYDLKNPVKYDFISMHIKNYDKQYIVYEISGIISYKNKIKDCYPRMSEIINELKDFFPTANEFKSPSQKFEGGYGTYDRYDLEFKNGENVTVICNDYYDDTQFLDHLSVGLESVEFSNWLNN